MITALLIFMAVCNAAGLLLIKETALLSGSFTKKLLNRKLLCGAIFMILSPACLALAANFTTLSRMRGYSSLSYIFILFFSYHFLREKIDWRKWLGSCLIALGIMLLR